MLKKTRKSSTESKMSFDRISNGLIYMKQKSKSILAGVLAITGCDIDNMDEYERDNAYSEFAHATMSLRCNHKYIFTSKTPYLNVQKSYLRYKAQKSNSSYCKALLNEQINIFESFEQSHYDRTAYLLIYGKNEKEIRDAANRYMNRMNYVNAQWCGDEEIAVMINKLLCLGADTGEMMTKTSLNDKLLPENVTIHSNFYCVKDKLAQTVVVYSYPAQLRDLEIMSLVSGFDDTAMLDIGECDKQQVLNEIQISLRELESRISIVQDAAEKQDTQTEFEKLSVIYDSLKNGAEQLYYITLRFLLYDDNLKRLQERSLDVVKELEQRGLLAYVPTNTMLKEFSSLVFESNTIENPFPVYDTLSRQYPFYYQSHIDDTGLFFGYTETGGLTILDTFTRNQDRNSYDLLAVGVKGGGKSVTLKSMVEQQLMIGNKVMVLDIESEYAEMARVFDGQVIKMNQNSRINPLQITKSVEASVEDDISKSDEFSANYASEMSRIRTFMSMYIQDIDMFTLEAFMELVSECLNEREIYPTTDISKIPNDRFPTFSDVLKKLKNKLKNTERLTEKLTSAYSVLEVYLKPLTGDGAYASMFDGTTNVDVKENSLVVFDVKNLSEMSENVYNAQLFNILTMMWVQICKNTLANQKLTNPWDKHSVVCLIDEAHRFISVKYPQVTEFIEKLVRRTRKYIAALWFATQSILDFFPSGDTQAAEKIKVIFSLVQYKVILKQSPDSLAALHKILPQFTESELAQSVSFYPGQMLLSLGSGRLKLHCSRIVTDRQMLYMGNAQDRSEIIHNCFSHYYNEYSNAEYGAMLKTNEDISYFKNCFLEETYTYLQLEKGSSEVLDEIVVMLVDSLTNELLNGRVRQK